MSATLLPQMPRPVALAARPVPLTGRLAQNHPAMLRRLGNPAKRRFPLTLTDLPFLLPEPGLATSRRVPERDARITRLARHPMDIPMRGVRG